MASLKKLYAVLDGNKFYLGMAVMFVLWLGWVFGWWSLEQVKELLALDGVFLGFAWRSAVKKLEK